MLSRHQPPEAEVEKRLQCLWASVLKVSPDTIQGTDNCFHLGADSFSALQLAATAEYQGLSLSVPDIFQNPQIRDQATLIITHRNGAQEPVRQDLGPFSLVPQSVPRSWLRERAAFLCRQKAEQVCDVFPCISGQEDGLANAVQHPDRYIAKLMFDLPTSIHKDRFLLAWKTTVASAEILRTRIIHLDNLGLMQVVLDVSVDCVQCDSLIEYNAREAPYSMGEGMSLCKAGLIEGSGRRLFVLFVHRVLFDDWSTSLILRILEDAYCGAETLELLSHRILVQHLLDAPFGTATRFWKRQLTNVQATGFPTLPSPDCRPQRNSTIEYEIENLPRPIGDTTAATAVRVAWALLQTRYTGADEIVFGVQVSGRHVAIPGVKHIAASTTVIVPLRISINFETSVEALLRQMQNQTVEMMPFELLSQKQVSCMRGDLKRACDFQTLLTVRTMAESRAELFNSIQLDDDQTETSMDVLDAYDSFALLLGCTTRNEGIKLRISFDSTVINNIQAQRVAHQFEHVLRQICDPSQGDTILADLELISRSDLLDMWNWNAEVPETVNECVHTLVAKTVRSQPDAPSICAWDGDLTYGELDDLSTRWAYFLLGNGVGTDVIVPICFEKSMWTPVAILGIMKAGGSWVALDHTQPEDRLRSILSQVNAKIIMSSSSNKSLATRLISRGRVVVVDQIQTSHLNEIPSGMDLPTISVASKLYITFTSGSTGLPKGVVITHSNFSSAIRHQLSALKIGCKSRVFDSPKYVFDTAWATILFTLVAGACVCTPCERDMHNPEKIMREMRVDFAGMTPTVAKMLEPSRLLDLKVLVLGGEALRSTDVQRWHGRVSILNTYGPSECTPTATVQQVRDIDAKDPPIGWLFGLCGWVVDTKNSQRLMGIGEVGELWLEGPLVGNGYLNNPEKTAAAFVNSPLWLLQGGSSCRHKGRKGRLYRTGDLVRRRLDGSLDFIGRKDGQVKIRGQRVELAEVEHHLIELLEQLEGGGAQAIAEVVMPQGGSRAMLVAFIVPKGGIAMTEDTLASSVARLTDGLDSRLAAMLPSYMIPSVYIPLARVPITPTAKVDHRRLREIGATSALDQLATSRSYRKQPLSTAMEMKLSQLWASVLGISEVHIGADDSFFRSGGDSITAMQLAGLARDRGFSLTVEDIFTHPRLSDLAAIMVEDSKQGDDAMVGPFDLLRGVGETISREKSAALCNVDLLHIEDVFPCMPMQAGLLAMTTWRPGNYVAQFVHQLREDIDIHHFRAAWDAVVLAAPILRTRIVDLEGQGLCQVVVREQMQWSAGTDLTAYCVAAKQRPIGLGTPLTEFGLIEDVECRKKLFVWTIHHSLFDGWSIPLLHKLAEKAYCNESLSPPPPHYQGFIKHILNIDEDRAAEVWRAQFAGLDAQPFPPLPSANHKTKVDATIDHQISGLQWLRSDVTASTTVQTAWAIWMARHTGSDDVLFGTTGNGRQAPVPGIERMTGPTFATVPIRMLLSAEETIEQLLLRTQKQKLQMAAFEQMGLARIQRISKDAKRACAFQTLLVVQPRVDEVWLEHSNLFCKSDQAQHESREDELDTYPILLSCRLRKKGLLARISFDSSVIGAVQVRRISRQFEHILRQVCEPENSTKTLAEMQMLSDPDLQDIWQWNAEVPQAAEVCVHDLFTSTARRQPYTPAVCAWDGELTYQLLDELSTKLAHHLVQAGVGPEVIVPLCFEKSMWTPVTMLAVMKAGGASLAMDTTLPEERLRTMVKQAAGPVILSSVANEALARSLADDHATVFIPEALVQRRQTVVTKSLPVVSPSNMLYAVFTSGSTGTPKGAIITHANVGSAVRHQQAALGIVAGSRVYDFASYAFDVSWSNHLHTLTSGGCLCIPSQDDRLNDIAGSIQRLRANYAALTPSVARLIEPTSVPELQTIRFCGEALKKEDVSRWEGTRTLLQSYGPAECTISATVSNGPVDSQRASNIGKGTGLSTWVLDVKTGSMLTSIGAIGELWLEGPLVGRGYLKDAQRTAEAFVEDPPWLLAGAPGQGGRRGSLYKTGDLVRYNSDGTLEFVGRKDSQVKLRGQRVELAEVEHHVRQALVNESTIETTDFRLSKGAADTIEVVVEAITPRGGDRPVLVALIRLGCAASLPEDEHSAAVQQLTAGLEDRLQQQIPAYMVPIAYIPVHEMPLSATGKTDRRRLRERLALSPIQDLATPHSSSIEKRQPLTPIERSLQLIWASVLDMDSELIGLDDNFIHLGGDSISAMQLVRRARGNGLAIRLNDILRAPRLCEQAKFLQEKNDSRNDQNV